MTVPYTELGSEFLVNTTTLNDQNQPTMTTLASGGFLVTWIDASAGHMVTEYDYDGQPYEYWVTDYRVFGQIYDAAGNTVGSELVLGAAQVDPNTGLGDQAMITGLASGGFVMTWDQDNADQTQSINAQMYDSSGAPAGDELVLFTQGAQDQHATDSLASGGFVVSWVYNGYYIFAQMFDAAGAATGEPVYVGGSSFYVTEPVAITSLESGGFVISWLSGDPDYGYQVLAQIFDSTGAPVGSELIVGAPEPHDTGSLPQPVITSLASGGFVVSWEHRLDPNYYPYQVDVMAQVFDASGNAVSTEFMVNTTTSGYQEDATITALASGGFVVSWSDGSASPGIKAQVFDAAGNKVGPEFLVNTQGYQPTITALPSGGFVVSWTDFSGSDGSGTSIKSQMFTPAFIYGTAGDDSLAGTAANETLDGRDGADTMAGAAGDDTYVVDNAGDVVVEQPGEGMDWVHASVSHTLADNVENLVLTGTEAIDGTGNALDNGLFGNSAANLLTGGAGDDWLDGGAGADTMVGGTGSDGYVVDDSGDVITEALGEGTDWVRASASYTLGDNVENMRLTGTAELSGTGNALNNIIIGNSAANTLTGLGGNDRLDGRGGADTMAGGSGNDLYTVDDAGDLVTEAVAEGNDLVRSSVSFTLGDNVERLTLTGSDAISGTGNAQANSITGNGAANMLRGEGGNDILNAAAGADDLYGGAGDDRLTGGTGADNFHFDTALSARTNVDRIIDFSVADDTIVLDQSIFTALTTLGTLADAEFHSGTAAADADDRIIYDSATGKIYYDADGNGAGAQVLFAQVTAGLAITSADFLVGA